LIIGHSVVVILNVFQRDAHCIAQGFADEAILLCPLHHLVLTGTRRQPFFNLFLYGLLAGVLIGIAIFLLTLSQWTWLK
jgi:formate/nitrite transporter FocA (FNT family)